ncbi:type 2 isopentenyl-diphosphate Delta-isomerase [Nocardia gamkensis]|uniref:Isopentenyl-diphosphate delta-isomerase n=1 Tax=Nocardia gamkensis TaxID=352869 RepID=A0A7X6KZJ6_9NOCA|nr:type 2 isopentenyl-diphosphate Delta-isomerase [Nocardia gamkensis]NKY24978.1 type 2 isopentenyl-diphosphate Delta-isomerase [Nocardia gamkensis]NQE66761.1 Isopentenyl-diphosphate delta-isomerase [Nocardia gamkensis]
MTHPLTIAARKDDHVRLAVEQRRELQARSGFDDVTFIHHALDGIDRSQVDTAVTVADAHWATPLYINAMTGGSVETGRINRELAIAARATGLAIATGSMSAYLRDPGVAQTYQVMRLEYPDGFILANVNATTSVDDARRAVELVAANALQIHLNAAQETVMPEGDRSFAHWRKGIERIVSELEVPVIVKEVGFGLSRQTVESLRSSGVTVADVSGRGGTNFALIENGRRSGADYRYLADWGQSTPACLLDCRQVAGIELLASGGVRTPLDVIRALALGARAAGASGPFLRTLVDEGLAALTTEIETWLDQLAALMTLLGARTPADLTRCDLLISGELRSFCAARGIDIRSYATRRSISGAGQ